MKKFATSIIAVATKVRHKSPFCFCSFFWLHMKNIFPCILLVFLVSIEWANSEKRRKKKEGKDADFYKEASFYNISLFIFFCLWFFKLLFCRHPPTFTWSTSFFSYNYFFFCFASSLRWSSDVRAADKEVRNGKRAAECDAAIKDTSPGIRKCSRGLRSHNLRALSALGYYYTLVYPLKWASGFPRFRDGSCPFECVSKVGHIAKIKSVEESLCPPEVLWIIDPFRNSAPPGGTSKSTFFFGKTDCARGSVIYLAPPLSHMDGRWKWVLRDHLIFRSWFVLVLMVWVYELNCTKLRLSPSIIFFPSKAFNVKLVPRNSLHHSLK